MRLHMTDSIEATVLVAVPVERVWDLVTRPEHLGRWFGDAGAEVDLRPGGELTMTWARHGTVRGRVEAVEPPRRFAFRWLAAMRSTAEPTPANSTLAEFTLSPEGDGTRVRVVESGFAGLAVDPSERTELLRSHTRGWTDELGELADHASSRVAGP